MVSIADFAPDDDHPEAFVLIVHVSASDASVRCGEAS